MVMKNRSVLSLNEIKTKNLNYQISNIKDLIGNYKKIVTIRELEEKISRNIRG